MRCKNRYYPACFLFFFYCMEIELGRLGIFTRDEVLQSLKKKKKKCLFFSCKIYTRKKKKKTNGTISRALWGPNPWRTGARAAILCRDFLFFIFFCRGVISIFFFFSNLFRDFLLLWVCAKGEHGSGFRLDCLSRTLRSGQRPHFSFPFLLFMTIIPG